MTSRTYNQVCALALALDVVGDRWTLLIARELLFGVRRYSDILRGTPGLGTNLLARRLKELEAAQLIHQRKLAPPAASSVYELTEYGRSKLTPIIRAFTNMGVDFLQYPPEAGQFVPASATMGALATFFQSEQAQAYSGSAEFNTANDVFHCAIQDGNIVALGFGELKTADFILQASTKTYTGLIVGYLTVFEAVHSQQLTLHQGTAEQITTYFNLWNYEST